MKRTLDLRTGRPVWLAYRAPRVPTEQLVRDIRVDVAVIGMGISGAMAAEALSADGLEVACIDRRGPMKGSTAATTALVQFEIDQPLSRLALGRGRAVAERAWRRSRLALANLAGRIAELGIDCRMAEKDSLYLAGDVLDADGLAQEADQRRRAGLGATLLSRRDLADRYGIRREAALLSHGNLSLDPRRLTAGMFAAAAARGARFYAPAEAAGIEHDREGVTVATKAGPTIRAGQVVLATGYELLDIVPPTDHAIISTWAIATQPQPRAVWPGAAFIWEASDPYLYMRATADGRVICGGEDEDFSDEETRDALIGEKCATIARKLGALMPGLDPQPEFAWTGSFGTTRSGLPLIGPLPRRPRIFALMGYGGNGITFSQIGSEMVASAIAGRLDTDATLFALK